MKRSISGWILIGMLSTATLSFGQTASTSLRGAVKDPTGALVPGAKITIVDAAKGAMFTATQQYRFVHLRSDSAIEVHDYGYGGGFWRAVQDRRTPGKPTCNH